MSVNFFEIFPAGYRAMSALEAAVSSSAVPAATVYTDAERAALGLTEAVTLIAGTHVPGEVEAEARRHYDDEAYAALVFAIVAINAWNRLAITGHFEPGHHTPASRA